MKNMMVASAIAAASVVPAVGASPTIFNYFDQCYLTGTSCGTGTLEGTLGGVGRGTDNLLIGLLGSPETGTGLLGALLQPNR